MAILFSNLSSEIPKQGTYGPKFKEFYFCTKHFNKTNSRTLISIMTILFQSCWQKHPNKALLVLDLKIFYFCMKLCFQKKEGDFRFDNIFFKFQPKKSSNQPFLFQIYALFLHEILQLHKFQGVDFKYDNIIFTFQPKNTQIRHFWHQI